MSSPSDERESQESLSPISVDSTVKSPRGRTISQRRLKKRKNGSRSSQSRVKRLKLSYSDKYRKLFNSSLDEQSFETSMAPRVFPPSQIGASLWSSREKACLLRLIASKGRHSIPALSSALSSKSGPEIRDYLCLIRQKSIEQELYAGHGEHFDVTTIESAAEISPACEAALEQAADALSALQHQEDEKAERAKYHDSWLLTPSIARWVSGCLRNPERGDQEVSDVIPAAMLLNLKVFLRLSKLFFMNSSDPESNWHAYAERGKPPSIMHTAFVDIHTLVITLTKRILSSAIFFANSRIRAKASQSAHPKPALRRQDVLSALETLGLDANARAIWCGVARKCNLKVYEDVRYKKAWGERFTYDEVEEVLANTDNRRGRYRTRKRSPPPSDGDTSERGIDSASDSDDTGLENSETTSTSEDSSGDSESEIPYLTPDHGQASENEKRELLQDAYMESHDQQRSQAEERRLWKILGDGPASKMNLEVIALPERPLPPSRSEEDLVDWTDWVDYTPPWETPDGPVPLEDFVAGQKALRRRRRRETRDTSRLSSQSSEEDRTSDNGLKSLPTAHPKEIAASDQEGSSGNSSTNVDESSEEF